MNEFSELELTSALRANLKKNNYITPTPVQAQSIPPALEGKDIVATAQTGTGKTLAFALPLVQKLSVDKPRGVKAVILSPTRELAIQISEAFALLTAGTGIRCAVVVGGMSENTQLRAIKQGASIVVATPGRLCDFLQRRLVDLSGVQSVVLDEADRMLDMGFLPAIKAILSELPRTRQTMLFSATIEKSVAHLVKDYVKDPVRIVVGTTTRPAQQIKLDVYEVDGGRKMDLLAHLLNTEEGSFLVFTRTKRGADKLQKQLAQTGFKAQRIHGDRTQAQRNQALKGFQDGNYRVLVATDVAARGIHVDGVAQVVNFDLPQVAEDFIHRVGRTGRAGATGVASTFRTPQERNDIRMIERAIEMKMNVCPLPQGLPSVAKLANYEPEYDSKKVVVLPVKPKSQTRWRKSGPPQRRSFGR